MADTEKLEMPMSRSRSMWHVPQMTGVHPDQSFVGKPIDPETVKRVRAALGKYKGPRNLAEHQEIITKKAEAAQRKMREEAEAYMAWAEKVKTETVPSFRFPKDPKAGMLSNDEYIKQKVKKGLREMRDKNTDYKAWVEDLKVNQAFKLQEKVQQKLAADEQFAKAAADRDAARAERDAEIQRQVAETQTQYWGWLRNMKADVAKRPCSVPAPTKSASESAEALTEKRKREMAASLKQQTIEYKAWLDSVSKPNFELPFHPVVDKEEVEKRRETAKKRAEESKKATNEYFEGVRKMETKHHERIMKRLNEKLQADKLFNEAAASAQELMQAKREAEAQKQREVAMKSRQELKEMYQRVKNKPLWVEMNFK